VRSIRGEAIQEKGGVLPSKDHSAMLHDLKKIVCKRQGSNHVHRVVEVVSKGDSDEASSSDSVNNDWKHSVVLLGDEEVAVEDVWGIGKDIGLKLGKIIICLVCFREQGKVRGCQKIGERRREWFRLVGGY